MINDKHSVKKKKKLLKKKLLIYNMINKYYKNKNDLLIIFYCIQLNDILFTFILLSNILSKSMAAIISFAP